MAAPSGRAGAALVVGVGRYLHPDRVSPLEFAARDATAVRDLLADPDLCGFPTDRIVLLTDAEATRDALVSRLSHWLVQQARGSELVVLYFAGHGLSQPVGPRDEGYLLPYDADPDDVVTRGVAMSDVSRWLEGVAASVVICLDCCHAGKLLGRPGVALRSAPRDLLLRPAQLQELSGRNRFLIASCDEGQQSIEADELRHGLFTYHLLAGLRGAADRDADGRVEVAELFHYVSERVAEDSKGRYGRLQKPWINATLTDKVFLSFPGVAAPGVAGAPSLEQVWRAGGPAAGRREAERLIAESGPAELARLAQRLGMLGEPGSVALAFRLLAHTEAGVREAAGKAVQQLGWPRAAAAVLEAAAAGADEAGDVLEGLAAYKAAPEVVGLLDRLAERLRGGLRTRALLLLERKRLGLELERVAELFRARGSPYRIQRVLGPGLFTAAYLARSELTDMDVVIRVLRAEFAAQPGLRAEFLDLSRRSVRFVHQNLVLTRDVGEFREEHVYYTVRDYVAGATLQQMLDGGKTFTPEQVQKLVRQTLDALSPLHEAGECHAGVKPSNLFVRDTGRVLLGDPSLAAPGVGMALERLAYDYRYAPPELFRGGGRLTPASDFYALGCVAYELLAGRPPFVSDSHYELVTKHCQEPVPPLPLRTPPLVGWGELLRRLLAKDPADRFQNLEEALEALGGLRDDRPPRRPPEPGPAPVPPPDEGPPTIYPEPSMGLVGPESVARYAVEQSLVPVNPSTMDQLSGPAQAAAPGGTTRFNPPGYEILGEIGRGGMGVVYRAWQVSLNRLVAIKVVLAGVHAGREQLGRFLNESRVIAQINHPNIVQVYDVGEADGIPYFAMEYVEGDNLARKLQEGPLPVTEAASLLQSLARAVQHAHDRGVVHRDLKPANVLLTADGTPKITDFGLAKRQGDMDAGTTGSGEILGTPGFMAPEQVRGAKAVGPAVDVYSLGVILYHLLTGRPPFQGTTPMETLVSVLNEEPLSPRWLRPGVPRDLEVICLKCLQKEPERRYGTAQALAEDLHRFLNSEPITARSVSAWERAWKWVRRDPTKAVAALIVALWALGSVMGLILWLLPK